MIDDTPSVAIQYVKERRKRVFDKDGQCVGDRYVGEKRGLLLAMLDPSTNYLRFGWSLCHRRLDRFDTNTAWALANARTKMDSEVPKSIVKMMWKFIQRWKKYFADKQCATVAELSFDADGEPTCKLIQKPN